MNNSGKDDANDPLHMLKSLGERMLGNEDVHMVPNIHPTVYFLIFKEKVPLQKRKVHFKADIK